MPPELPESAGNPKFLTSSKCSALWRRRRVLIATKLCKGVVETSHVSERQVSIADAESRARPPLRHTGDFRKIECHGKRRSIRTVLAMNEHRPSCLPQNRHQIGRASCRERV